MVKAITPRYRYDQLMRLGWKVFLPFSLIWVVFVAFAARFDWFWGRSPAGAQEADMTQIDYTAPPNTSCCKTCGRGSNWG